MPRDRVLRRIEQAADDGRLVRLERRRGWDRLDGSIVARSAKWLLVAVEVDAGFNGHSVVRVSDIRQVDWIPSGGFVQRALDAEGTWPLPPLKGIDVRSTRGVLASLAASSPLVSVFYEREHPDECLIGVPSQLGRKKLRLRTVTPEAEWEAEDTVLRYRSVSRVDVGGAYERRLSLVAGPPPSP